MFNVSADILYRFTRDSGALSLDGRSRFKQTQARLSNLSTLWAWHMPLLLGVLRGLILPRSKKP